MQIKTIKLFKFDELSDEAKAKSIEDNRDINTEHWCWWHAVEDRFKFDMKELGYEVEKMYFSGFWSQGDGACFEGRVYVMDWLKAHKLANKYRALYNYVTNYGGSVAITQSGHYYHSRSMVFQECDYLCSSYYLDEQKNAEKIGKQIEEVLHFIEEESEAEADKLYKNLENEYDYLSGNDMVSDVLIANEYDFLESGGAIQ